MPGGLEIARSEPAPGVVALRVAGEVDLGGGSRLGRELAVARAGATGVVVDLTDCTFLDSSGLSALINAARAQSAPGAFAVACPEGSVVRRVFRLTRTYDLLDVHPDVPAALAALGG